MRKRVVCWFAVLCVGALVVSCATTPATQLLVDMAAQDAGYLGYKLVPEARGPLSMLCTLTGDDAGQVESATTDLLGQVWTASNTQTGSIVCLKINQVVEYLKDMVASKTADSDVLAYCKRVIAQVCAGVRQAGG